MFDHAPEAILAVAPRARSRGFLVTLALVTLVSLIGVPLFVASAGAWSASPWGSAAIVPSFLTVALITGPVHVATTAFFYFDSEFKPVLRESRWRCLWALLWLPLLIMGLGLGGTALIGGWAYLAIFVFHNVWLFYHYQRQNFGLASFISSHLGAGRLPPRVNQALNVAALGAIVALIGTPGFYPNTDGIMSATAYGVLRMTGTVIYAASLVLMASVFRSERRLRQHAWLVGALVMGVAFFLPTIAFRSVAMAFFPVAIAHGAQYLMMMVVVSGRAGTGGLFGPLVMAVLGAGFGVAMDRMMWWPAILFTMGVVQVHFLVDAKVWRLREPRQRAIMSDRFDFLLA